MGPVAYWTPYLFTNANVHRRVFTMKISIERLRWSWRRSLLVMLSVGLSVGASQATAEKIVLATGADPCFGVFYVPHEIGAFKEAGLETELVTGASGSRQVPFILTGDFHFAMGSGGACMTTHDKDPAKAAMFASGSGYRGYDGVVSRDDIADLVALKGKKVGLALGTGSETFFTTVVEKAGHAITDYEVIPVEAPEMVAALERGDIDAYAAWEPWVSRGVISIPGTHQMLSSEGLWEPVNAICGNKQWAEANPEDAATLFRVMAETAAKMAADPDWAAGVISKVIKLDPDLSRSITKKCSFMTHLNQLVIDGMVNDYNNLVLREVMPKDPSKDWWRGYLYDKPLKAAAPGNVSYSMPGN